MSAAHLIEVGRRRLRTARPVAPDRGSDAFTAYLCSPVRRSRELRMPEPSQGDSMYLQDIGANIRAARVDQRLSRQDLADASGVSHPVLALIERGEQQPSLSTVAKLASVLRVDLPDLAEATVSGQQHVAADSNLRPLAPQ